MAYFAEIDQNNKVIRVISINDDAAPNPAPSNSEPLGKEFIESIGLDGIWKQCSYNNNFRNIYPGIGYWYLEDLDVFVKPKPFPSWSLDSTNNWESPIPMPETGGPWNWNEELEDWEQVLED